MKKYLVTSVISFVTLALLPLSTLSAGVITAQDTVAGIGTEISCSGLPGNEDLTLTLLPPLGAEVTLRTRSDERGNATIHINGEETQIAGTYTIQLNADDHALAQEATFTVLPDTVDEGESSIETNSATLSADGSDAVRVTVLLRDQYLNPLAGRPVELIPSRKEDRIAALSGETDREGQQVFRLSTKKPGPLSLRAMDLLSGKLLDAQVTLVAQDGWGGQGGSWEDTWTRREDTPVSIGEVNGRPLYAQLTGTFDVIDHFRIVIEGSSARRGGTTEIPIRQDTSFRVIAEDRNGQTVEDYVGDIRFSSTDPKAILPFGTRSFAAKDLGAKTFTLGLRFNTPGEQILAVEDDTGKVNGMLTVNVTGGVATPEKRSITITEPKEGATIGTATVAVKGSGPPLINLIVTGGSEMARGETDADGFYQVPVTLSMSTSGATLQVQEATGKYSSNELHIFIDSVAPRIESVTYSPSEPAEEQSVKVSVVSESGAFLVTLTIDGKEVKLMENAKKPGTFEGSFTAPKEGKYQPLVTAADSFGNKSELLTNLTVKAKTPSKVQNLRAEGKISSVELTWDALPEKEADAYRVYVGEDEKDFAYTLDTEEPVTTAIVAGLRPATTYYFAITAIKDNVESAEKSDTASATVLGMKLTATPGDASLMLEWTPMKNAMPLSAFLLEFGVEPDQYTEKRMVSGDAQNYTLHDLLNGVTYELRLTPIATTGEVLRDLSATTQGTPNGSGYHAVAGEGTFTPPPPPMPPPTIVRPGLPPAILWGGALIGAGFFLFLWNRRRTLHATAAFLQAMDRRYRE